MFSWLNYIIQKQLKNSIKNIVNEKTMEIVFSGSFMKIKKNQSDTQIVHILRVQKLERKIDEIILGF